MSGRPLSYEDVFERVDDVTAIYWNIVPQDKSYDRVLFFNATIPLVKNNIDTRWRN
jgi:hypothetical protein